MSSLEQKVEKVLAELRPFLQRDGGDVVLDKVDGEEVYITFTGFCSVCDKSPMTLYSISETIKKKIPEIKKVIESEI